MKTSKPLINKKYLLEKFPGKGGWTFARIPEIPKNKKGNFGWRKVKGTIDGFPLCQYHLMSMGDGNLFLPVKAEIRKRIKKKVGDFVQVILFADTDALEVPDELMMCLKDEPRALKFFNSISESEKKYYIQWIYSAKREETKVNRMAKAINRMAEGKKMYEVEKG